LHLLVLRKHFESPLLLIARIDVREVHRWASRGESHEVSVAFVVGLRAEARLARRLGLPVVVGGGTAAGAAAAAQCAVAAGATALVSFGLAGGLDPSLRRGELVVPTVVLGDGAIPADCFTADPALTEWLGGATPHRLLAADAVAADVLTKQRLWQRTGAAALDLESGAVARTAAAQGLRFAVLRAICDPAGRDLPPAALAALDARGAIGLARVACAVAVQPGQIPALLRLAADAAAARHALARRVAAIRMRAPSPHNTVG
jgi:adenosylhomocysteine nucleosidase